LPGKIRPRNDLICVEWDVKPCSTHLNYGPLRLILYHRLDLDHFIDYLFVGYLPPTKQRGNVFGGICLCVRMSVCNTITFESLDVKSLFSVCGYTSSGAVGQVLIWRSLGHRSKHQCAWYVRGLWIL